MNSVSPRSGRFPSIQQWSPIGILAGGIFVIDLLIPLGVAAGVLYIAVILLSLRYRDSQLPLWTAVGCSILTIVVLFITPVGGEFWKVLVNRALCLFAIWTTTLMGRVQLQQANANQENLLLTDRVFMASNDHISILGQDYRYRRVNPSYEKVHGKESQEVVGMSVSDLLGKEIFEQTVKPKLEQCFQGKEIHYESWFRFADDQDHYMTVSYLPLVSEDKKIEEIVVIARDLTDRKRMEETVQANQQQLRTILDAMTNFIGIGSVDGIVTDCNKPPLDMAGLTREDVIGKSFFDTYWLNHSPKVQEQVRGIIQRVGQGEIVREDYQARMGENFFVIVDACFVPVKDTKGQVQQIVHSGIDVTTRRHAEQALEINQQKLQAIMDHSPNLIFMKDLEGRYLHINKQFEHVFQVSNTTVIGATDQEIFPPEQAAQFQSHDQLVIQSQAPVEFEETAIHSDEIHTSLVQKFPLQNKSGEIYAIGGIATDITHRKQMETELCTSESRYRSLIETAGSIIIGLTPEGWIVEWNREAARLFGKTREEVLDENYFELFIQESDRLYIMADIKKVLAGKSTRDLQNVVMTDDENKRKISWNIDRLLNNKDQPYGVICIGRDITEWEKTQLQLQKWATIYQHTQWGVAVGDANSQSLDMVNEAYARMHGYTVEELQGQPISQVFATEFRSQLPGILQLIHDRGFHSFESLHIRKDGTTFPALLSVSAIKNPEGVVLYRVANVIDISELKHAEEALKKSEERFRTYFESGLVGMAITALDKEWVEANDRLCTMLGYSREELRQKTWAELTHPDDLLEDETEFNKLLSGTLDSYYLEKRFIRKDGSLIFTNLYVNAVRTPSRQVEYVTAMIEDISERKQTEKALKESEERFRSMFEQAAVGVAQVNTHTGAFIKINQRYCDIAGYSQEEMKTKTFQAITHPEDLKTDLEDLANLRSGKIKTISREKRYIQKNGSSVWINLTVSPLWQDNKEPSFHITVVEDITKRKSLEDAIQKHNEELEITVEQRTTRIQELEQRRMQVEKLAALSQIAAGVAHEINNPLASISQSLVLIKRAISENHPHYRYIAKTEDCIQRIATITKNLYQLYRPSGPTPMPVDIRMCIQTATEIMEERALTYGMRITVPSLSKPIMTQVSQSELIQVLCNLLHNAIDASPKETTIEISLTTGSKSLTLFVADQGEGIPPEAAPHIFEPFYTTKQHRTEGGMGLGLSISHSLVESMGGSLDFSTAMGQGSTFTITLPLP